MSQGQMAVTTRRLDADYIQDNHRGNKSLNLITIRDICP